jgi:hypothetical protein
MDKIQRKIKMIERDDSVMPTEQEVEQFLIDYHWMHNRIQKIAKHLDKDCDLFAYDPASPSTLDVRWEEYDYGDTIRHDYNLPTHYLWTMDDKILVEERIQKEEAEKRARALALRNKIATAERDIKEADQRTLAFKTAAKQRLEEAKEALKKLENKQ